jgi:N-acetylmuramoyl-L-alanine amidase
MKRPGFSDQKSARSRIFVVLSLLLTLAGLSAALLRADEKADSQKQFERAVKMRTMLEGLLEKDRALSDYQQTVLAFRKVYLISADAPDATQALVNEAELYESMGRLYDSKFFRQAVTRYNFLLKQYPGTRFQGDALLAIGKIQKDDLKEPEDAEATFKEYLHRYPHSENAARARQALKEIAASRQQGQTAETATNRNYPAADSRDTQKQAENVGDAQPDLAGQAVEPRVSDDRISTVNKVQTWNSPDSTRIIVTLNGTIKYESARVASPDRIYFNLYRAKVSTRLTRSALEVNDGLLQSVHVAQNKPDVVRLVLNVTGEKDYSAFLLANPYRLVIDLHSRGTTSTAKAVVPANAAAAGDSTAPATPNSSLAAATSSRESSKPSADKDAAVASASIAEGAPARDDGSASAQRLTPGANTAEKTLAEKTPLPLSKNARKTTALLEPPPVAKPTRDGQRSLTRTLGLKISRIVIDAGHGGHDTGTVGPRGLMEKDLCLDVALRLGNLIEQKLPAAEVIYTRKDDTFVPLEERTSIANQAQADLFISIHANSSPDTSARGVETYYLNFATTEEAMAVASRENALSQESMHDLQDLIQKIARNDKVEESKEFATDIQDSLAQRLQLVSRSERNRGVKKAPFVVLIGANMPSILTEISFVSNPSDERLLRKGDQRQRIAEGLFRGISAYLESLNSLSNNKQKLISANPSETSTVASNGNPK